MNILLLTIVPKNSQKMIRDIIDELVRRGNQVFVVCPSDVNNVSRDHFLLIDGVWYLFVKSGNYAGKASYLQKITNFITVDAKFEKAIRSALPDNRIDLILYSTPPITLVHAIGKLKKRTNAFTYLMLKDIFPQNAVDMGMMKTKGIMSLAWKYFRKKEKRLYRNSDYIGCMSPANCSYILNHNPELREEQVGICVNSYKAEPLIEIDRGEIREKYEIPQDTVVFLYGGNLGKPQGLQFLIDVLEQNKEKTDRFFLICGGGNDQDRVINYIQRSKQSNAKYIPLMPADEFDVLSRACDVGMVSLDRRFTIPNFPSRMLSIMLNQMPILAATDTSTDVNEMIQEGDLGWWCESKNPSDMTTLLDQICLSPDKIETKGENARRFFLSYYTTSIACDQIEAGIKKVRPELFK